MIIKNISKLVGTSLAGGLLTLTATFAPIATQMALTEAGINADLGVSAHAQDRKPRRLPGIGQKLNEQMNKVAEYISPSEVEGKPTPAQNLPAAEKLLNKLERDCLKEASPGKRACNGNELGNIYRFLGILNFEKDNLKKTAFYFEKIIEQSPQIPIALEEGTLLQLAKILAGEEEYKKALVYLDRYMKFVTIIPPDAYYTKSTICYQMEDLNCALTSVNKAISLKENADLVPKEQWYNLQRGIYNQKEDYKNSLKANIKLITHYPKASYWNDLGTFYSLLENFDSSMYVLDVGLAANTLDKENQYLQLAQLLYQADAPYNAARVIEEGLNKNIVKASETNLEKVGRYFYSAREYKKAINYLTKAGDKSDKGDIYADVVGLYVQIEDMDGAIAMAKKALNKKGGLKKPGRLHFQMGAAYFEQKKFSSAISAFEKAAKYKPTQTLAEQWLDYSKKQKDRYERLEKFLNS